MFDIWPSLRLHKPLHETRVRFINQPLRFRSNSVKDQRGLAGTRNASKDSELTLGDINADIFQVIIARTNDANIFLFVHPPKSTFSAAVRWRRKTPSAFATVFSHKGARGS